MTINPPIALSPGTIKALVIAQSVLSGVAMVAGAATFSETIGAKYAGLAVVVVAAVQQVITSLLARASGQQAEAALETVERAGANAARAANVASLAAEELSAVRHRQPPPPRR